MSEVFAETAIDAGAVGFVLSQLSPSQAPILWVQDRLSASETGQPYLPGLGTPLIRVSVNRVADLLWVMEEGLACPSLRAVVAELWGTPPALSFTATKRLAIRAEAHGVAAWMIRRAGARDLSAARERWVVGSLPSAPNPHDVQAPGQARWRAELFRSRHARPGSWIVTHDRATDRVDFAAPVRDGTLDATQGAAGLRGTG